MHGLNRRPFYFTLGLLMAGTLMNCDCESEQFLPSVTYDPFPFVVRPGEDPGRTLVFGDVAVNTEKTLAIRVQSNGQAAVHIVAANLVSSAPEGMWRVAVADVLAPTAGLAPGRTSTIAVTFRPCPAAWNGDQLRETFDYGNCPGMAQAADLEVTDNTVAGSASFGLSGRPVQPPSATVWCPVGPNCGVANPQLRECNGVIFGSVNANDPPCDLVMEVRNQWRLAPDGQTLLPTGELEIQRIDVLVQDNTTSPPGPILSGAEVGFTIHDLGGDPLQPDPGDPFFVSIPDGQMMGANQFKFRFSGARTGIWVGRAMNMTGLRLYTNDPDKPLIVVPVSGQGSAPQLNCTTPQHNYGPVAQGTTATATISCRNGGDADLIISNIAIQSGNPEFVLSTSRGSLQNITLRLFEQLSVYAAYTPQNTGVDSELLVLTSNDPINGRTEIPLLGGPVPELRVDPNATLSFPLPPDQRPPRPPQTQTLTVSNVGYGDLNISRLVIQGPNQTLDHPSVDDFTIPICNGQNPCNMNIMLCAPDSPGCGTGFMRQIEVVYSNNDISTIDLAELHIFSDDPSDPDHIVVLEAEDEPCLFPTPVITVTSPAPQRVGTAVTVDASSSNPGPPGETITACEWSWLFVPGGAPPAFNPPSGVSTSFVPAKDGIHILGLHCTNSCGARSQNPGQETIPVSNP